MPKASVIQVAYNAGQLARSFEGRADHQKYATGGRLLENFVPQVQGPLSKRPGTRFVAEIKNSTTKARLVPFQFNTEQAYVFEMGNGYARIFAGGEDALATATDGGQIVWPTGTLDIIAISAAAAVTTITYDIQNNIGIRLQNGVSIGLRDIGGEVELNDRQYEVENLNELLGTFDLKDTSSVGYTLYTSGGLVDFGVNIGTVVEFATPYTEVSAFEIQWAQSADVLYVAHKDTPPQKIERRAHYLWVCSEIEFNPPPFAAENPNEAILLAASHAVDQPAISASPDIVGIRITATGGDPFSPGMVGQSILLSMLPNEDLQEWRGNASTASVPPLVLNNNRMRVGQRVYVHNAPPILTGVTGMRTPTWSRHGEFKSDGIQPWKYEDDGSGWATIIKFEDSKNVLATVKGNDSGISGQVPTMNFFTVGLQTTYRWAFTSWNAAEGYPRAVTFYEDRLWWGGSAKFPNTLWASKFGDYENHNVDDTIDGGQTWTINDDQVNQIEWMTTSSVLSIGTSGGEFVAKGLDDRLAISGENPLNPVRNSQYGSKAHLLPLRAEDVVLFVQRAGRKVREFVYQFETDRYVAPDLSIISEDLLTAGIKQWAYQQEPQRTIWCVMEDGTLRTLTYERSQNVVGWAPQAIGGSKVNVISVAVIPHPDDVPGDQVWFVVEREINGVVKRYVEFLEQEYAEDDLPQTAFYVDGGLSLDVPLQVADIEPADIFGAQTIITSLNHGLVNNDEVIFSGFTKPTVDDIESGTLAPYDLLEGKKFLVTKLLDSTFIIKRYDDIGIGIDPAGFNIATWDGVGVFRKMVDTITGLDHLEGETVDILGDGSVHGPQVVSGGSITLTSKAGLIHVGLGYDAKFQSLRIEAGAQDGASQGRIKRIENVQFRLLRTGPGLFFGVEDRIASMDEVLFRAAYDPMTFAKPFFSGDTRKIGWPNGYETDGLITIRHNTPTPCTLIASMLQIQTEEG